MPPAAIHVLVIDDSRPRAERLTAPFPSWGWQATIIPGEPRAALGVLAAEEFDLVLLDVRAAEKGNFLFLRRRQADKSPTAAPIVITAYPGAPLSLLSRCVELGAADTINHPHQTVLMRARLQNILQRKLLQEQATTALEAFNEVEKIADDLRLVILPIGAALSAEPEYERLIARIVTEAQRICNADAGALYLAQDDGLLHPVYARVTSRGLTWVGDSANGALPIPLSDPDTHAPNYASLPVRVALGGDSVNLTEADQGRYDLHLLQEPDAAEPYIPRTVLAVPLRNEQIVGALVLADSRHPLNGDIVEFDAYHQQVAESLASQAAVVLNNRLLNERQTHLMRFKRELEIGREIQLSFLPAQLPQPPGWELEARFQPALEVAGDFYDAFEAPNGRVALVIADVVGKGVTAALFMAIIRSLFRAMFQQTYFRAEREAAVPDVAPPLPPDVDREALLDAVRLTNAYLIANHGDAYAFATLFAGVLEPETGRLLYVNAGHNPPLVVSADAPAAPRELAPTGPAIGLLLGAPYRLSETTLRPGDLLFAFTDGVVETRDPSAEEFGQERLEALLAAHGTTAAAALAAVEAAVADHASGAEAFDDVTMLALRRL